MKQNTDADARNDDNQPTTFTVHCDECGKLRGATYSGKEAAQIENRHMSNNPSHFAYRMEA